MSFQSTNKSKKLPTKAGSFQSVKTYITLLNGVWGVAPSGVRAAAPHLAPARMPGVYAKGLCKDAKPTKHTQSFATGKGFGVRD